TIDHFTELKDTPDNYSGQSGKFLQVNSLENSLQFTDVPKDTAEQIVSKIETLKGTSDALSYTSLKDLPSVTTSDMLSFKTGLSIKALNNTGNQINGNKFVYIYPLKDGSFSMKQMSSVSGYKGEMIGYVRNNVPDNTTEIVELITNIQTGVVSVAVGDTAYIGFTSQDVVEIVQKSSITNEEFWACGVFGEVNDINENCVMFDTFKMMADYYAKFESQTKVALIDGSNTIPRDKDIVIDKVIITGNGAMIIQHLPDATLCNGMMLYAIVEGSETSKLELMAYNGQQIAGATQYELYGGTQALLISVGNEWIPVPLSGGNYAFADLSNVMQNDFNNKLRTSSIISNKADIDLENVDFTRATRFNNAVMEISKRNDTTPTETKNNLVILPVATTAIDFSQVNGQFFLAKYQMTSNQQTLTQILPSLSTFRIIIIEKVDGDGVSNTILEIQPYGAELINGLNIPLRITDNGIVGLLINAGTTWEWIPYPILHENGIVISDDKNNVFLGEKNIKFIKSTLGKNGDDVTVTPDPIDSLFSWENLGSSVANHKSKGAIVETPLMVALDPNSKPNEPMSRLYIDHDYYERKHGEGIFAKLSRDVQIDLSVERTDKIWFDELRVGNGNTFVYPNMSDKSFVIQDVDPNDDPNVTGGTLFLIAFDFQPKENEIALSDGYLEIKAVDTSTGDYMLDVEGNPIQSRIDYKNGDTIKSEFLFGVLKATASTNCAFEVGGNLGNEIVVSTNSCIMIQSILHNEVDGLAYLAFCNYTGYRWTNTNRYYGNGIVWFGSALQQDEIMQIFEPNSGQLSGNGIFIHNAGRIQAEIQNHIFMIRDNGGTDLPIFCLGKLFDATDSRYIKGKQLESTVSLTNKKNTFVMSLMGWEGQSDKANYMMLTGFNGTTPQFIANWSEIETYQIDVEPNKDLHLESYTFTIPTDVKYTQFALIIRPYNDSKPMELDLANLDANISPSFNVIV
ncbi:MAG: hypothetical protein ACRDD8_16685, partial [Bacteroidales bacterium]